MVEFLRFIDEFFSGWRRRTALLALALLAWLVIFWMRSFRDGDVFVLPDWAGPTSKNVITSSQSVLAWRRTYGLVPLPIDLRQNAQWHPLYVPVYDDRGRIRSYRRTVPDESPRQKWLWRFCGIGVSHREFPGTSSGHLIYYVPYWALAIPLILFTAWLLISKPRRTKEASLPPDRISN